MRETILEIVNRKSGIKFRDLALDLMAKTNIQKFENEEFLIAIMLLIEQAEILKLDYSDPVTPNIVESMFFKKGTIMRGLNAQSSSEAVIHRESKRNT